VARLEYIDTECAVFAHEWLQLSNGENKWVQVEQEVILSFTHTYKHTHSQIDSARFSLIESPQIRHHGAAAE